MHTDRTHDTTPNQSFPDFLPPEPVGRGAGPVARASDPDAAAAPPAASFPSDATPSPGARRGRGRRAGAVLALTLAAGTVGGLVGTALGGETVREVEQSAAAADRGGPSLRISGEALDLAGIVDAVEPAVAAIEASYGGGPFGGLGGRGAGTGVVLTADGDVLTNAHVVNGADQIRVTVGGESQSRRAELVGLDAAADLALLHLPGAEGLPVAPLGRSADVAVGDDAVAIGNALGLRGGPSVTRGIISALERSLPTDSGAMTGLIQTDASISSGNSGGPLVNAAGEVIGINTAVATGGRGSSAENIGFAIPIDKALPIVDRLRRGGPAPEAAFLGVSSASPTDGSRGATIVSVEPGSAADEAGIRPGDLLTHVDGNTVAGAAELGGLVSGHAPGERVTLTLVRDGEPRDVAVTLGSRPSGTS
ncbi:MAG: S1C family serine protease [Acidimicrobiia bacterium]